MQTATHATHSATPTEPFDLDAGMPSLAFVNTLRGRRDGSLREHINSYQDLLAFSRQTGEIDAAAAAMLAEHSASHPHETHAALQEALTLREALFEIFSAVAAEVTPPQQALAALNAVLRDASSQVSLVVDNGEFRLRCCEDTHLHRPIWPLAREAAELLLGPDRERIRECANDKCGWVFLDTSRNRSRRWCSMSSCGNRAKVRSFRERASGGDRH